MGEFDANFDGQRLMYHPYEVAGWHRAGRTKGPVYTEFELCSYCNCRCSFCGVDHLVNKEHFSIEEELAKRALDEMAGVGNKAVMFSGHGEPLLHGEAMDIIGYAAEKMAVSVTTNGISLDAAGFDIIDSLDWIRFSVNAGTAKTYEVIHGVKPQLFEKTLGNVERAVARKRDYSLPVTIGVQLVLLDENRQEVLALARLAKELGVDYFSVKPYSQHPLSTKVVRVHYEDILALGRELKAIESSAFRIIFREESFRKLGRKKSYEKCFGTHFLNFISASGDVWECNIFVGDPRFKTGNLLNQSFGDIWNGPRRREVLSFIDNGLCLEECRDICRMDACNCFLWRLKNPGAHDSFI